MKEEEENCFLQTFFDLLDGAAAAAASATEQGKGGVETLKSSVDDEGEEERRFWQLRKKSKRHLVQIKQDVLPFSLSEHRKKTACLLWYLLYLLYLLRCHVP